MASSSTTPFTMTIRDEFKYFKEFTRLVAVKRKEATTDKTVWLWDFMQNTLRFSETTLTSSSDMDSLILTAGDFLTDLFFICSTLHFSASQKSERDPLYTFETNIITTNKLMQNTRWFIYHYRNYYQSRWKRLQSVKDMKDIAERLCHTVMAICRTDDLHDILRARIQRGLSHCKLHRERTRHMMQNPRLAPMLTNATIHPITYDLAKTTTTCPQIARFLLACGVDMNQKHITLTQVTEKVYNTLMNFAENKNKSIKEITDMLVKQIFTTERVLDLTDQRSLWWPIGKWLCMESYEEQFNSKYPDNYQLYIPGNNTAVLQNPEMAELRETEQPPACLDQDSIPRDVLDFLNLDSDQGGDKEDYRLPFCEETFYSDSD